MNKLIELLNKKCSNKFNFLKLYEVTYDYSNLECVVTFLYPHSIPEICEEDRKTIDNFVKQELKLNSKIIVKFKKSFLDVRLIKNEVFSFINANFKA